MIVLDHEALPCCQSQRRDARTDERLHEPDCLEPGRCIIERTRRQLARGEG